MNVQLLLSDTLVTGPLYVVVLMAGLHLRQIDPFRVRVYVFHHVSTSLSKPLSLNLMPKKLSQEEQKEILHSEC